MTRSAAAILILILAGLVRTDRAAAGPICPAPRQSLTAERDQSAATALVRYISAEPPDPERGFPGQTVYEVIELACGDRERLPSGTKITLNEHHPAEFGDFFLLRQEQRGGLFWSTPTACSIEAFDYVCLSPHSKADPTERLRFFLPFLEYSDSLIADDAYFECVEARFQDLIPLAGVMRHDLLRMWIADPATPQTRIELYGKLLGICGREEDAEFLRQLILAPTEEFRLGIDGIVIGYLLLTGERGLAVIEESKLRPADVPFSEMYAAMQALRFLWHEAPGCIERDGLLAAMRLLLDRPDVVDLAIIDLTRCHDWSVTDRLMEMYGAPAFDAPSIKRAIVRFLLDQRHIELHSNGPDSLENVCVADRYLTDLQQRDPETVKKAERFFFVR